MGESHLLAGVHRDMESLLRLTLILLGGSLLLQRHKSPEMWLSGQSVTALCGREGVRFNSAISSSFKRDH